MNKVVYWIKNNVNGKFYIGSTISFKRRRKEHVRNMNKGVGPKALQNAYNKYGKENFTIEIIYFVPDHMDMYWAEEQFILHFDTINNGYNIQLPVSDQGCYSGMSRNNVTNTNEWLLVNGPNNLKSMSKEEWIEKRRKNPKFKVVKKLKDKKDYKIPRYKNSKPVIRVSKDGDILERFNTCYSAQSKYGIVGRSNISSCCTENKSKGIGKHMSYGFYWFFENSFDKQAFLKLFIPKNKVIIPYRERKVKRTPITIQNIETEEILNFQSIVECSEYLKVNKVKIHDLIRGRRNKGRGVFSKVGSIKGYRLYGGL